MSSSRLAPLICSLLALAPGSGRGNPCAAARVDGRSVLPASGNQPIRLAAERIRIHLSTEASEEQITAHRKRFRIDYHFVNPGPPVTLLLGFPVVVPRFNRGPSPALHGFAVKGQGVGRLVRPARGSLPRVVRRAELHWCEQNTVTRLQKALKIPGSKAYRFTPRAIELYEQNADGTANPDGETELVGWYFWRQRFRRGSTRFQVRYTMTAAGICHTRYVLRTARHWAGGTIGRLTVELRLDRPARMKYFKATLGRPGRRGSKPHQPAMPRPTLRRRGLLRWQLKNFRADRNLIISSSPCAEG